MDNKELLEEIRLNRQEIRELKQEFFIFKGKAFGFMAAVAVAIEIIKRKFLG